MKLFFLVMFMVGVSNIASSQIDMSNNRIPNGFKIPAEKLKENKKTPSPFQSNLSPFQSNQNHSLTAPEYRNGFSNPTEFFKEEETLSMSTDNGLKERTIEFKPNYLPYNRDSGGKGNQTTQYLGEFVSTGKFVEIYSRDHQYVDGDRVQVLVNGEIVAHSITLSGSFQPVLVTLEKGVNRIEIKALNEGASSPNTAEFIVYDQMGNVITQNRWNLAAGVEARIVINKP